MLIDTANQTLAVAIPLTQPTGKIRIKTRSCFSKYGEPVKVKQVPFSQLSYNETLLTIKDFLQNLTTKNFIDYPANFATDRSHPVPKKFLGIDFFYTQVKYPLLIHKFESYEILNDGRNT